MPRSPFRGLNFRGHLLFINPVIDAPVKNIVRPRGIVIAPAPKTAIAGKDKKVNAAPAANSPKPTAFQHYLTQSNPDHPEQLRHYGDSNASTTLRGHKLYWHVGSSKNFRERLQRAPKIRGDVNFYHQTIHGYERRIEEESLSRTRRMIFHLKKEVSIFLSHPDQFKGLSNSIMYISRICEAFKIAEFN